MLDRNDTQHYEQDLGSNVDLIMTGSTSRTLVGDTARSSSRSNSDDFEQKKREYDSQDNMKSSDQELIGHIVDRTTEEKKITRIIDCRMMPLFCIFYFVDFLDRANIGNATLAGIQDDLHLSHSELSTAISAFYITYILFEVPSNIILKRTSAVMWLSLIMLLWGTMTLVMAFSKNFHSLLACRLLLGAAESGYIPGILYMMSRVYRPRDFGLRLALLLCMSSVSGIVSGPIAYGTSFLEGQRGLHGWQYLFILEGVPTICLSVVSYFYLFDDIKSVPWLTDTQKALHRECTNAPEEEVALSFKTFLKAILDWKTFLFATTYLLTVVNLTSYQIFAPTIIDGFGFPVLESQLLSAPPNVAQTISIVLGGYLADKYKNKRGALMVTGFSVGAIGYMLLIILQGRWARYAALFVIPAGLGLQAPANIGWSAINFPNLEIRVIAVAVVVMIGNSGGVIASYLYPVSDGPHYYFGNAFNLCCAVVGALFSGLASYLLYRQNRKLDNSNEKDGQEGQFRYYY
ncbi:glycine hydroxymethyltransferase shm1 [Mucor velutinosus]|uniref:Glycine hydroxymethyltransferase shm1 n=1 Tax=Mucor velutinosus TaxID=708070 RepID=A0AAN7DSD8_9FUNG|nr:glycine hydroxymethyltransferase shm1 [Mucor velutinosus]